MDIIQIWRVWVIAALKEMTSGNDTRTVYVPYEASSVLNSIGSIKELSRKDE